MSHRKTKHAYILAASLKMGDEFKTHPRLRNKNLVHWTQEIHSGPMAGKILIMTRKQRPFFLHPDTELVHCNPSKNTLTERLPQSLCSISAHELQEKLTLRTQQICQNTDLSSHLIDLLQQEIIQLQEEIHRRKNSSFDEVFLHVHKLETLIKADAIEEGQGMTAKHHRAKELISLLLSRAHIQPQYAQQVLTWIADGGTRLLRDQLLKPLGYEDDRMRDFDAFVLLDDLRVQLRGRAKNLRKAKRKGVNHG